MPLDTMDPLDDLRSQALPILREAAAGIQTRHPNVRIDVFDGFVGDRTEYQGFHVGLEALLQDKHLDEPDSVALEISVRHLDGTPEVDSAGVTWGHPGGTSEAETFETPVEYGPEVLPAILEALPGLVEAFERAVARGRPPA